LKGRKHTAEAREKISESHKGKKHSDESKRKMSLAKRGKGRWNLHHKIPIHWFVKEGLTDPKILNALNNLKPLWRVDHTDEHKSLRKFTKEQKKFWVELFTWHVEHSRRKPINLSPYLIRQPIDIAGYKEFEIIYPLNIPVRNSLLMEQAGIYDNPSYC